MKRKIFILMGVIFVLLGFRILYADVDYKKDYLEVVYQESAAGKTSYIIKDNSGNSILTLSSSVFDNLKKSGKIETNREDSKTKLYISREDAKDIIYVQMDDNISSINSLKNEIDTYIKNTKFTTIHEWDGEREVALKDIMNNLKLMPEMSGDDYYYPSYMVYAVKLSILKDKLDEIKNSIDKKEKLDVKSDITTDIEKIFKKEYLTEEEQNKIEDYGLKHEDLTNFIAKYNQYITKCNQIISSYKTLYSKCDMIFTEQEQPAGEADVTAKCGDGNWWKCAWQFIDEADKDTTIANTVETALGGIKSIIFDVGNIIFILVTAYLGVKYIWGSVESKFEVKNSLITLVVAAMVFYGWNAIEGALNIKGILTGTDSQTGHMGLVMTIYNTIMYIINVAAIGGIIYIGIKYMMAGADGKAEMKLKFIPVIMGIIMVYGTLNLIKFILDITVGSI